MTNIPYDKIIELAGVLGVSPSFIMGWESVQLDPDTETAADVAWKISKDDNLAQALEVYFKMPPDKQKHVIETIYLLGGD